MCHVVAGRDRGRVTPGLVDSFIYQYWSPYSGRLEGWKGKGNTVYIFINKNEQRKISNTRRVEMVTLEFEHFLRMFTRNIIARHLKLGHYPRSPFQPFLGGGNIIHVHNITSQIFLLFFLHVEQEIVFINVTVYIFDQKFHSVASA